MQCSKECAMVPKIGLTGAARWGRPAVRWRRRTVAGIWRARTGGAKSPMDGATFYRLASKEVGLTHGASTDTIQGSFAALSAVLGVATMYAVIATGGKQYRVQEGAVVRIEKLEADQGAGVEFNQVLLVGAGSSVTIGAPYVGSAKVVATVESHGKGDKVRIVKFRRRKHYKREKTHRQPYTDVKITSIVA